MEFTTTDGDPRSVRPDPRRNGRSRIGFIVCLLALVATVGIFPAPASAAEMCGGVRATIVGNEGPDRLVGGREFDVIIGLGGNDIIVGKGDRDVVCAGSGNDLVRGGKGNDIITGEAGNDVIKGGAGRDWLGSEGMGSNGGAFRLRFASPGGLGEPGNDVHVGEEGRDTIVFGRGKDRMYGGPDKDYGTFYTSDNITFRANLARGVSSGAGRDRLFGLENLAAFSRSDVHLIGDRRYNTLVGGTSFTSGLVAQGRGGKDVIYSWTPISFRGPGTVRFSGGSDNDLIVDAFGKSEAPDVLRGGAGHDQLWNQSGGAALYGGPDADELRVNGYAGEKTVYGGPGTDVLMFHIDVARAHVDLATGVFEAFLFHDEGSGTGTVTEVEDVTMSTEPVSAHDQKADVLIGNDGPNRLLGGDGPDRIDGAGGDDDIQGGSGDDDLDGGPGYDVLFGSAGTDACRNGESVTECES